MTRPAANRQWMTRLILSLLAVAGVVWSGLQQSPQTAVSAAATPGEDRAAARETLRIGMWTLWHDREVLLTPSGPDHKITVRSCTECGTTTFTKPVTVRADGNALALTTAGKTGNTPRVLMAAPVTLTAHGETVTLNDPATITARNGVLVIVVTLAGGTLCGAGGRQRKRRGRQRGVNEGAGNCCAQLCAA